MTKAKSGKPAQKEKPWWRYRRNRNKVWLGLFGAFAVVTVALFVWFAVRGGAPGEPKVGQEVKAFELPDVVSGQTFSLANYLGKQDIVLVGYMGFF